MMHRRVNKSAKGKCAQVFIRCTWVDDYSKNIAKI